MGPPRRGQRGCGEEGCVCAQHPPDTVATTHLKRGACFFCLCSCPPSFFFKLGLLLHHHGTQHKSWSLRLLFFF